MKYIGVIVGLMTASNVCLAQSSPTNILDKTRFLICYEGQPVCRIQVSGLESERFNSAEDRRLMEADARRLQRYFHLLTGCTLPIEHADPLPKDRLLPYTIELYIGPTPSGPLSARIYLVRGGEDQAHATPTLVIMDNSFGIGTARPDGKKPIGPQHGKTALDVLGERYFGVPLSVVDDPTFDWSAHHRGTLAINYADFQPIQFPPPGQ